VRELTGLGISQLGIERSDTSLAHQVPKPLQETIAGGQIGVLVQDLLESCLLKAGSSAMSLWNPDR